MVNLTEPAWDIIVGDHCQNFASYVKQIQVK